MVCSKNYLVGSLLQIGNLLEARVEAKESTKNILKNLKRKNILYCIIGVCSILITWVEEQKSAGVILYEKQLFTHFLLRGVK
jgi:hypothetical protein